MNKRTGILCPEKHAAMKTPDGVILCFFCGAAWIDHKEIDYGSALDELDSETLETFYRLGIKTAGHDGTRKE
jgi:hypothetical protein